MSQKEIHNYDIRIATNGDWYHEGSKINRIELVKLFASVLHKKDDNKFWLITPKEEGTIEVDDAPFVITKFDHSGSNNSAKCWFTTNLGEKILLSKINPLRVEIDNQNNPRPYIYVFRGMEALILRSVYYEVVNFAVKDQSGEYGIWSDGSFFRIGYSDL